MTILCCKCTPSSWLKLLLFHRLQDPVLHCSSIPLFSPQASLPTITNLPFTPISYPDVLWLYGNRMVWCVQAWDRTGWFCHCNMVQAQGRNSFYAPIDWRQGTARPDPTLPFGRSPSTPSHSPMRHLGNLGFYTKHFVSIPILPPFTLYPANTSEKIP